MVIATAVIAYGVYRIDVKQLLATLVDARLELVAAGLLAYVANYLLRALRFHLLMGQGPAAYGNQLLVTVWHGSLNYLLPARLGELSYPWLANRLLRAPVGLGIAALLTARVFDVAVILALTAGAALMYRLALPPSVFSGLIAFLTVGIPAVAIFFVAVAKGRIIAPPILPPRFRATWQRTGEALRAQLNARSTIRLSALSVGIWGATLLNFYLVGAALHAEVTAVHVLLLSALALPLSLLPTQGVANIGPHEFAWVIVFQALGDSHEQALSLALGTHVLLFGMVCCLATIAVIAWCLRRCCSRSSSATWPPADQGTG